MNLRKMVLAVVAASTMLWSFAANAEPNYYEAQNMYFNAMASIHNECSLYWTYDPDPYSNYGACVAEKKYLTAQGAYVAASIYWNYYYPDGSSVGETYLLVANALYYGF